MMLQSLSVFFVLVSLFMFKTARGEAEFRSRYVELWRRGQNSSEIILDSDMDPFESAQEYLGKFGWVEPTDWTSNSPRINETIEEGETLEIESNEEDYNVSVTNTTRELSEDKFAEALRNFQVANGLEPTGELDDNTIRAMIKLRCGVPDLTKELNRNLTLSILENFSGNPLPAADSIERDDDGSSESDDTPPSRRRRHVSSDEDVDLVSVSAVDEAERKGSVKIKALNDLIHLPISEGELPEQSRAESIEGVIAALRKEKMLKMNIEDEIAETTKEPFTTKQTFTPSSLLQKIQDFAKESQSKHRQKRSDINRQIGRTAGWGMAFAKRRITWRLVREWANQNNPLMTNNEIWFTVKLAFRMWSEILPREFVEDNHSSPNEVDILVGFGEGTHNRCPVTFNSGALVREYAHAWSLPKSEIHFNGAQPFVPVSWMPSGGNAASNNGRSNPISLLKVATHEIGHALGLPHSDNQLSIMNPYYQPFQNSEIVELSRHDRQSITSIYGTCDISFNVVFDWVRQSRQPNGRLTWKYNTYFYRHSWYWLYENKRKRPRYGDPKVIASYWRGVLLPTEPYQRLDGAVHVRSWRRPNGPTFFFKGENYTEYDSMNDRAKTHDRYNRPYPRRIADDFPGVPYPIDTVFFNIAEELLYFFKDNKVYRYSWTKGELLDSATISTAFPGWGGATALPHNIDAAYYSYAYQAYYFFKGTYYWKLADAREKNLNPRVNIPYNSVGPKQKISSKWNYICDVGNSELVLRLPPN